MSPRDDDFDFFVSYARADNKHGWVTRFIEELQREHRAFVGDDPARQLRPFFDKKAIRSFDDWQSRIRHGLARSRLFVAFLSPNYFASEWCRREWKEWIDTEIAKHILSAGAAPIYFVEVPGFVGKLPECREQKTLSEQEVAEKVAELCALPEPHAGFIASVAPVVRQMRDRRQITSAFVKPLLDEGLGLLQRADLRAVLKNLAQDLEHRIQDVKQAAASQTTVPPYNKKFSGRLDELKKLRDLLKDDPAGVVCGIYGLGGVGKSELAFTYAHAFASAYPGGRFLVSCEGRKSLSAAVVESLGSFFRRQISDKERKDPRQHLEAVRECLRRRLSKLGHILLVLDNVTDLRLISASETDLLTKLGPALHILVTSKILPPKEMKCIALGDLDQDAALDLVEKHRAFANADERSAARVIVKRLGCLPLAIELVASWLEEHPDVSCRQMAADFGVGDVGAMAGESASALRRYDPRKAVQAVLAPVLATLNPAERLAVEYAAFLPEDVVALPWIKRLVEQDLRGAGRTNRWSTPWDEACRRLKQLALFMPVRDEEVVSPLVRMSTFLQECVRSLSERKPEEMRDRIAEVVMADCADALNGKVSEPYGWQAQPLRAIVLRWLGQRYDRGPWIANAAGMLLTEWGSSVGAEEVLADALEFEQAQKPPNEELLAALAANLGSAYQTFGKAVDAVPLLERAIRHWNRQSEPDADSLTQTKLSLALAKRDTGALQEASALASEAMTMLRRIARPADLRVARALATVAAIEADRRDLKKASSALEEACRIAKKAGKTGERDLAHLLADLGALQMRQRSPAEARKSYLKALEIEDKLTGPSSAFLIWRYNDLAEVEATLGKVTLARQYKQTALRLASEIHGPDHPVTKQVEGRG